MAALMSEIERTPISERERYAIQRLAKCRFLPGSREKRFARDMAALADSDTPHITARQRAYLWIMVYRYRRQISDERLVAEANACAAAAIVSIPEEPHT